MNLAAENNNTKLTADEVAEYLEDNPDFFLQYPDLLLMMRLSDQPQGSFSLVERQMQGLRQRNTEFRDELRQVIRNAQDNQHLLQQTIDLSLSLIPCENIAALTEALYQQLDSLFDIKYQNLLLDKSIFTDESDISVDMHSIRNILGDNFPKQQPVCGRLKDAEKESLFDKDVAVNSAAILPLGKEGELGLLVLGSEDPAHFDPEMGDLFLLLIADMLSRLLYRYSK